MENSRWASPEPAPVPEVDKGTASGLSYTNRLETPQGRDLKLRPLTSRHGILVSAENVKELPHTAQLELTTVPTAPRSLPNMESILPRMFFLIEETEEEIDLYFTHSRPLPLPCDRHLCGQEDQRSLLNLKDKRPFPSAPLPPPPEPRSLGGRLGRPSKTAGAPVRRAKCSHWVEANKEVFSIYDLKEAAAPGTRWA